MLFVTFRSAFPMLLLTAPVSVRGRLALRLTRFFLLAISINSHLEFAKSLDFISTLWTVLEI